MGLLPAHSGRRSDGGSPPLTLRDRPKWRSVGLKSALGGDASIFKFELMRVSPTVDLEQRRPRSAPAKKSFAGRVGTLASSDGGLSHGCQGSQAVLDDLVHPHRLPGGERSAAALDHAVADRDDALQPVRTARLGQAGLRGGDFGGLDPGHAEIAASRRQETIRDGPGRSGDRRQARSRRRQGDGRALQRRARDDSFLGSAAIGFYLLWTFCSAEWPRNRGSAE